MKRPKVWYTEYNEAQERKGKKMSKCEFCAPVPADEWNEFKAWMNANPYEDDKQVDDGMLYMLKKKKFYIACNFDGGYIGDSITLKFNFCPMCGRPL